MEEAKEEKASPSLGEITEENQSDVLSQSSSQVAFTLRREENPS